MSIKWHSLAVFIESIKSPRFPRYQEFSLSNIIHGQVHHLIWRTKFRWKFTWKMRKEIISRRCWIISRTIPEICIHPRIVFTSRLRTQKERTLKNHFRLQTFLLGARSEGNVALKAGEGKSPSSEIFIFLVSKFLNKKTWRRKVALAKALNGNNSSFSGVGASKRSYEQTFFNVETVKELKKCFSSFATKQRQNFSSKFSFFLHRHEGRKKTFSSVLCACFFML